MHLVVPLAMIAVLFIMLVPLPTMAMDFFLTVNLTMSLIILMVAMYVERPISLSVFPSLLLLLTLFRLSLNLASTRLILLNGSDGTAAAGRVIRAFGEYVVGGSFIVGLVVFLVIIVIQYVVVSYGATRIAEVTARFMLDAMPGKQMSIDADLSSGLIDEYEARNRRDAISREADFYGAMDGAIRFTKRDAVAGIIITLINIVAGIIIGVVQFDLTVADAIRTYSILTIGDGLVSAIPSLLVSVAGGIVTTRASSRMPMGEEVAAQLGVNPKPLYLGSGILFSLALVPGFPLFTFMSMSGICFFLARRAVKHEEEKAIQEQTAVQKPEAKPIEEQLDGVLKVDLLSLEIGYGLIPLVDRSQGGDLVDRIKNIRRQIAAELGIIVPPIHISDNLKLQPREYSVLLKDSSVEKGEIHPQYLMAINPGGVQGKIEGIDTREPSYDLPAVWIKPEIREQAQIKGFTVVDAATVLSTHLAEVVRKHAADLLTRQETKNMVDRLAKEHPKLVEELIPNLLSLGEVQKVLQNLLRERVPIRDLLSILETLADFAPSNRNVIQLTEHARQSLKRAICSRLMDERNELRVFTLSPAMEQAFQNNLRTLNDALVFIPEPEVARNILEKFHNMFGKNPEMMRSVILCASTIRPYLRQFLEQYFPYLTILSYSEIPPNTNVISMGMVN